MSMLAMIAVLCCLLGQAREVQTMHHARGTFTVEMKPLSPAPAEGLVRYSINKQVHGDLEGSTQGEMFSGGDPKQGSAGYVAIEVFTGDLGEKHGTFALQHFATMDAAGPNMMVKVVPGSGTGAFKGMAGVFTIVIDQGKHSYDLEYALP